MPEKCTQIFLTEKNVPMCQKNVLHVQQYFKVINNYVRDLVNVTTNGKKTI